MCSTVKKADSSIGFLRRNLQIHQKHIKANAYKALVRPQIECVYYMGSFHPTLKMVQRSARFACNNYRREESVATMLDELGWRSLQQRRADQ